MYLLALRMAELRGELEQELLTAAIAELKHLPHLIAEMLEHDMDDLPQIAEAHFTADFFLYLDATSACRWHWRAR